MLDAKPYLGKCMCPANVSTKTYFMEQLGHTVKGSNQTLHYTIGSLLCHLLNTCYTNTN